MLGFLKWTGGAAALGYAGFVLLLYLFQRTMLYIPAATHMSPAEAGLPQAKEVALSTADGEKVIAWHVPPREGKSIIIYLHGNAEILAWKVDRHRKLVADGTGLLALSYRGYAGSTGVPTEAGLHRDADAAYEFVAARVPPDRIVVWGHSLGTGVAVRLAAERPIGKLILEAPYTSTADVAAIHYPFVPVRLLMKDQFRSDLRIKEVGAPVLVLHGARDDVIPIAFGQRLYELVPGPKRFVRFPEGGHVDLDDFGALEEARHFIDGSSDP
jgi:fermentation-respiration switch protein FrsA (DUF1100 family)